MQISKAKLRKMIQEEARKLVQERYEKREIEKVIQDLKQTSNIGRIKVTSPNAETKWLNFTRDQMRELQNLFL